MIAFCMGRWLVRYDLQDLQSGDEAGGSAAFVPWESEVEVSAVWAGADAEAEGDGERDSLSSHVRSTSASGAFAKQSAL